jgi:hypothetical protein
VEAQDSRLLAVVGRPVEPLAHTVVAELDLSPAALLQMPVVDTPGILQCWRDPTSYSNLPNMDDIFFHPRRRAGQVL